MLALVCTRGQTHYRDAPRQRGKDREEGERVEREIERERALAP